MNPQFLAQNAIYVHWTVFAAQHWTERKKTRSQNEDWWFDQCPQDVANEGSRKIAFDSVQLGSVVQPSNRSSDAAGLGLVASISGHLQSTYENPRVKMTNKCNFLLVLTCRFLTTLIGSIRVKMSSAALPAHRAWRRSNVLISKGAVGSHSLEMGNPFERKTAFPDQSLTSGRYDQLTTMIEKSKQIMSPMRTFAMI